MAEKIKIEIGNNDAAIDEDSQKINVRKKNREKYNSRIVNKKNHQFSLNIFFYSYPFPFRCIKRTIGSLKNQQ